MTCAPQTVLTDPRGGVTIANCVTEGTFSLDGETFDVENNVWVVGNQAECVVIDPAHDPDAVLAAVADRTITHVLLTHGHDDHIAAVREITDRAGKAARVVVPDYQLSLAIGKEGQNARLAAKLTGWRIDIRPDTEPGAAPAVTGGE